MTTKKGPAPPNFGIPSPCFKCEERHVACHDHCDRYVQYKKKLSAIKDAEYADAVSRSIRPTAHQKKKGDRRWARQ